jgi:acyl-CoA hydrolase
MHYHARLPSGTALGSDVGEPPKTRKIRDSLVETTELVLPEDTNPRGSIFGGRVLALIDKCAAMVAMRHTRADVVTVAMDSVEFRNAVRVGDVLVLRGRLNAAFGSSMEIEVEVRSEDPYTGRRRLTTRAFVTMVCVDPRGRPQRVPELELVDDDDRVRAEQARARRERRLAGADTGTKGA